MRVSFKSDTNPKSYEDFVKFIFTFLSKNNLLVNDNNHHIIAIQLKPDGHHIILQNQLENKDAKNIEFFDESLQVNTKKTVVFSYDSKNIIMNFSEDVKDKTKGTEKYVNLTSKSFIFDRKSLNFLELKTNSLNNLLDLIQKDTTKITSLDEQTSMMNKIRLKFMTHDEKDSNLQIEQLRDTYHQGEMFFYKKGKNQENSRVEALGTRFTCSLNDIFVNEKVKKDIPPQNLLSIFNEIISQLKARGFPHGDLSPRNILLREDDTNKSIYLKVIDAEYAKIDGHLRGGHTLKEELSIDAIVMDLTYLSSLAGKCGLDENFKTILKETSRHLQKINDRIPFTGQDAVLEKIYGCIMQNFSSYLNSIANSINEKPSSLPAAESIKKSIDEVVEESLKPSQITNLL